MDTHSSLNVGLHYVSDYPDGSGDDIYAHMRTG